MDEVLFCVCTLMSAEPGRWLAVILGFSFSILGGHLACNSLSNRVYAALGKKTRRFAFTTSILGVVERTLYAASVYLGRPEFIGGWLVLKVAGQWQLWEREERGRAAFNSFLSGAGLSLFFGYVGGRTVSWLQECQIARAALVGGSLIIFSLLLIWYAKRQMDGHPSSEKKMYERPRKASHLDVIRYEADMLHHCRCVWKQGQFQSDAERNLYLEGFLAHYRNLMRFFSGKNHRLGKDLSTAEPLVWAGRQLTADEIRSVREPALRLDEKYHDDISQYLQHCTVRRFEEEKGWDVEGMYQEIAPIIASFKGSLIAGS